jgi:hypothetical protein
MLRAWPGARNASSKRRARSSSGTISMSRLPEPLIPIRDRLDRALCALTDGATDWRNVVVAAAAETERGIERWTAARARPSDDAIACLRAVARRCRDAVGGSDADAAVLLRAAVADLGRLA